MDSSDNSQTQLTTPEALQKDIEELKAAASQTVSSQEGFAPHYLPSQIEELTGLLQATDEQLETTVGNVYDVGSFARVILYKEVPTAAHLYNALLLDFNVSHKNRTQTVVGDQFKKTLEQGYTLPEIRNKLLEQENAEDITDSQFVQLLWDLRGKD